MDKSTQLALAGVPDSIRAFFRKNTHRGKFKLKHSAAKVLKLPPVDIDAKIIEMSKLCRCHGLAKEGQKRRRTHTGMMINGFHSETTPQTDGYASNQTFDVEVRVDYDNLETRGDDAVVVQLVESGSVDQVFQGDGKLEVQVADEDGSYHYDRYGDIQSVAIYEYIKAGKVAGRDAVECAQLGTNLVLSCLGNAYRQADSTVPESADPSRIEVMTEFHTLVPGEGALEAGIRVPVRQGGRLLHGGAPRQIVGFSFKGLFSKIKSGICKVGSAIKKAATKAYKIVSSKIQQMGGVGSIVGALVTAGTGVPMLGKLAGSVGNTLVGFIDPALAGSTPTDQTPSSLTDLKEAAMAVVGETKTMIINDYITPSHLARLRSMSVEDLKTQHGRTHESLNSLKVYGKHQVDPTTEDLYVEEAFAAATMNAPEYEGFAGSGDDSQVPSTQALDYAASSLHFYYGFADPTSDDFCLITFFRGDVTSTHFIAVPRTTSPTTLTYDVYTLEYTEAPNWSTCAALWPTDTNTMQPAFVILQNTIPSGITMAELCAMASHIMTLPVPVDFTSKEAVAKMKQQKYLHSSVGKGKMKKSKIVSSFTVSI